MLWSTFALLLSLLTSFSAAETPLARHSKSKRACATALGGVRGKRLLERPSISLMAVAAGSISLPSRLRPRRIISATQGSSSLLLLPSPHPFNPSSVLSSMSTQLPRWLTGMLCTALLLIFNFWVSSEINSAKLP